MSPRLPGRIPAARCVPAAPQCVQAQGNFHYEEEEEYDDDYVIDEEAENKFRAQKVRRQRTSWFVFEFNLAPFLDCTSRLHLLTSPLDSPLELTPRVRSCTTTR